MDEMDGPQEAGKRLYGHVELDLCVSHGRCKDRRRKEEWVARLYGLSDPGLGSIEVAACDAHVARLASFPVRNDGAYGNTQYELYKPGHPTYNHSDRKQAIAINGLGDPWHHGMAADGRAIRY